MQTEPTYLEQIHSIGDGVKVHLKGENWGRGLEDTAVKIEDNHLCWITWNDKDAFLKGLRDVIDRYRI